MQKNINLRQLTLGLLFLLSGGVSQAGMCYSAPADDCCYEEVDNCCGTPLRCGRFGVAVKGGFAPTTFVDRENLLYSDCNNGLGQVPAVGVNAVDGQLSNFNKLYKFPFYVAGEVNYNPTENVRFFAEVGYRQAKAKTGTDTDDAGSRVYVLNDRNRDVAFLPSPSKFAATSGYVGWRWYSCRVWCERVSFFLGGKVGFTHHKQTNLDTLVIRADATETTGNLPSQPAVNEIRTNLPDYYFKNNVVSGGGQIGLDICWNRFSLLFTFEAVGEAGLAGNRNFVVFPDTGLTQVPRNINVPSMQTIVYFPITATLGFNF